MVTCVTVVPQNKALCNFITLQCYASVSKHKLSRSSWVRFLQSNVLCLYLSGEAPPTCCYHGDSPSWVSCLQRSDQDFSAVNSVGVQWDMLWKKVGSSNPASVFMAVATSTLNVTTLLEPHTLIGIALLYTHWYSITVHVLIFVWWCFRVLIFIVY